MTVHATYFTMLAHGRLFHGSVVAVGGGPWQPLFHTTSVVCVLLYCPRLDLLGLFVRSTGDHDATLASGDPHCCCRFRRYSDGTE